MRETKTFKASKYRWEYETRGASLICKDNTFYQEGQIQARCESPEIAQTIADIMNEARKPENILNE